MSKELDELKQFIAEHGLADKYADELQQMELMEEQTAKLEKANAEMRDNLAKAQEHRSYEDSINALREDVAQIKAQTAEKPLTKEDILSIKDNRKRVQAISENLHLFQRNAERPEDAEQRKAQDASNWHTLSKYGITKSNIQDMTKKEIIARVPSGYARVFALNQIIGK